MGSLQSFRAGLKSEMGPRGADIREVLNGKEFMD